MAVYTDVSFDTAAELIARLSIGTLTSLQPCAGGIENTNYFADTTRGRYVLTLFERLTHAQLPFYLQLMKHLAERGIPVPGPHADASGSILHTVHGKPAAVVDRLPGRHHLAPDAAQARTLAQTFCCAWPPRRSSGASPGRSRSRRSRHSSSRSSPTCFCCSART